MSGGPVRPPPGFTGPFGVGAALQPADSLPEHPARTALDNELRQLIGRLSLLRQEVPVDLPAGLVNALVVDFYQLGKMAEAIDRLAACIADDFACLHAKHESSRVVLAAQTREHEAVRQAAEERLAELRGLYEELDRQRRSKLDVVKHIEKAQSLGRTVEDLRRAAAEDAATIQHLKDQLEGKRNLWIEIHKPEAANLLASATIRVPGVDQAARQQNARPVVPIIQQAATQQTLARQAEQTSASTTRLPTRPAAAAIRNLTTWRPETKPFVPNHKPAALPSIPDITVSAAAIAPEGSGAHMTQEELDNKTELTKEERQFVVNNWIPLVRKDQTNEELVRMFRSLSMQHARDLAAARASAGPSRPAQLSVAGPSQPRPFMPPTQPRSVGHFNTSPGIAKKTPRPVSHLELATPTRNVLGVTETPRSRSALANRRVLILPSPTPHRLPARPSVPSMAATTRVTPSMPFPGAEDASPDKSQQANKGKMPEYPPPIDLDFWQYKFSHLFALIIGVIRTHKLTCSDKDLARHVQTAAPAV